MMMFLQEYIISQKRKAKANGEGLPLGLWLKKKSIRRRSGGHERNIDQHRWRSVACARREKKEEEVEERRRAREAGNQLTSCVAIKLRDDRIESKRGRRGAILSSQWKNKQVHGNRQRSLDSTLREHVYRTSTCAPWICTATAPRCFQTSPRATYLMASCCVAIHQLASFGIFQLLIVLFFSDIPMMLQNAFNLDMTTSSSCQLCKVLAEIILRNV